MIDAFVATARRNGVVLDTNLFLLLVIGRVSLDKIGLDSRISKYDQDDYRFVSALIQNSRRLILTPHILSEISNHLVDSKQRKRNELSKMYLKLSVELIRFAEEKYVPKDTLLNVVRLDALGFADSSILEVAKNDGHAVLTDDFTLCKILEDENLPVLSIGMIRAARLMRS